MLNVHYQYTNSCFFANGHENHKSTEKQKVPEVVYTLGSISKEADFKKVQENAVFTNLQ